MRFNIPCVSFPYSYYYSFVLLPLIRFLLIPPLIHLLLFFMFLILHLLLLSFYFSTLYYLSSRFLPHLSCFYSLSSLSFCFVLCRGCIGKLSPLVHHHRSKEAEALTGTTYGYPTSRQLPSPEQIGPLFFLKRRVSGIYLGVLAVVVVMVAVMLMLGVYVILVLAAVLASIGIAYLW